MLLSHIVYLPGCLLVCLSVLLSFFLTSVCPGAASQGLCHELCPRGDFCEMF